MIISLSTEEITSLVENHIAEMGIKGNLDVSFKSSRSGTVDASIEITPASATAQSVASATETAIEPAYDSLIK